MENITIEVLFQVFFVGIVIDFITGVLSVWKAGKLKSRVCSDGIFRSIGESFVLFAFIVLAHLMPHLSSILSTFMLGFIFKEGLSICENLNNLGVWIPQFIKNGLEVNTNKADKGEL